MKKYTILGTKIDEINRNNIIYPKEILQKAIDEYMLKDKYERIGLYDYPEDFIVIDMSKKAFVVEFLNIVDNQLVASISTLETPFGDEIDKLVADNGINSLRIDFLSAATLEESNTIKNLVIVCPVIIKYENWAWNKNII